MGRNTSKAWETVQWKGPGNSYTTHLLHLLKPYPVEVEEESEEGIPDPEAVFGKKLILLS